MGSRYLLAGEGQQLDFLKIDPLRGWSPDQFRCPFPATRVVCPGLVARIAGLPGLLRLDTGQLDPPEWVCVTESPEPPSPPDLPVRAAMSELVVLSLVFSAVLAFSQPSPSPAQASGGTVGGTAGDARAILQGGAWTPSPEQADAALSAGRVLLAKMAGEEGMKAGQILARFGSYRVQFQGRESSGRRLVWCNFFPAVEGGDSWRREAVLVLDGGISYWQFMYDPSTGGCLGFLEGGDA